ncbi:sulfatase-like hydrolase/transferase [Paludisphaera borealis]|uniref:Choline-sulfatase n=1 Tax=Paludisphaera borealis TaxID=1387353 RepID=A0A1U7CLN0_9BACT|nr:sulfatase-like hydrolase/transferase [Paludisphaera borealis]APW59829.1 Choline-sulfatase [Paludisphaera borealis]
MTSLRMNPRGEWKADPRDALGRPSGHSAAEWSLSPLKLTMLAALFGLFTGGLELVQWLIRNAITGGVSLGSFQMSRHFVWMIPASNLSIFLVSGLALGGLAWFRPRLATRLAVLVFGFLCFLALLLTIPGLYGLAAVSLAGGFGTLIARRFAAQPARALYILAYSLPVLGVAAFSLAGWDVSQGKLADRPLNASAAPVRAESPNVLLLVLDTVRAESLSLYGCDRDTTPNLARLAKRGIRFEQARSTAPWTLPSHASMFTGRWPHELKVGESRPLDSTYPTLAEYLTGHGYATGGFIANTFFCNAWFGLGRGFDHYDDFYEEQLAVSVGETLRCSSLGRLIVRLLRDPFGVDRRRKDASQINGDFLAWLEKQKGQPFFAFINYFDAHTPYVLPEGAEHRFGRPLQNEQEVATIQGWDARSRTSVTDAELTLTRNAYDDCLAYLDAEIGKLFDDLERRGVLDDTIVILTSDHGENHGEHGLIGHGRSLYDQEVHVPLLVFLPGGAHAGEVVADSVSLRDIPATAVDLLKLKDGSPFPGVSLARCWESPGDAAAADVPVLTEVLLRDQISKNPNRPPAWRGPMYSIVAENQTYIRNADGQEELYDLRSDPAQARDQAASAESADVLLRMRERLKALAPQVPQGN